MFQVQVPNFRIITKHMSYFLASGCSLMVFSTRHKKKKTCHITDGKVNYHMTWLTTNNKCLKPGYFFKIWLITKYITHQDWTPWLCCLKIFHWHPNPSCHTFLTFHWLSTCRGHFSSSLIGHQDTWLIIISCLLIIIPGICITSHAFMMSRSLIILLHPCLILLKFVFQYIATLCLFYHCISMFISYALCIKTWPS